MITMALLETLFWLIGKKSLQLYNRDIYHLYLHHWQNTLHFCFQKHQLDHQKSYHYLLQSGKGEIAAEQQLWSSCELHQYRLSSVSDIYTITKLGCDVTLTVISSSCDVTLEIISILHSLIIAKLTNRYVAILHTCT